jgi:hypothetical protein
MDDLCSPNEVANPLVGMSTSNVHKDDVVVSDANLGPNRATPVCYVQFIGDVNAVMGDRCMFHAESSAGVLRARALGIEHDGTRIRGRGARTRDSKAC